MNSVISIIPSPSPSTPSMIDSTSSMCNTSLYFSLSVLRSSASEIMPFPSASNSLNMRCADISRSSIMSASAASGCLLNVSASSSWCSSCSAPSSSSSSSRSKSSSSISAKPCDSSAGCSSKTSSSSVSWSASSLSMSSICSTGSSSLTSSSDASSDSSSLASIATPSFSAGVSSASVDAKSSPERILSNSSKSMTPLPSASISSTNLSICDGGKSASFRLSKPDLSSCESIVPSSFVSNLSNNFRMLIPVSAIHCRRMSTTSSATNSTPHSEHLVESSGTSALHAPHSPSASSETPENEVPQSGHTSVSIGIMARQAPHSAMPTNCFSSSAMIPPSITMKSGNIMVDGDRGVEGVIP